MKKSAFHLFIPRGPITYHWIRLGEWSSQIYSLMGLSLIFAELQVTVCRFFQCPNAPKTAGNTLVIFSAPANASGVQNVFKMFLLHWAWRRWFCQKTTIFSRLFLCNPETKNDKLTFRLKPWSCWRRRLMFQPRTSDGSSINWLVLGEAQIVNN